MPGPVKRTTVYLDSDVHQALRLKSRAVSRSMSDLVNSAIRESLSEDAEDIAAFENRASESLISYDDLVKRF